LSSSNVFRFVAIRAPDAEAAPEDRLAGDEDVVMSVVAEMESSPGRPPSEVRAEIGARLLASDRYYVRNPESKLLLPALAEIEALIARKPPHEEFVDAAVTILASALAEDVDPDRLLDGDRLGELRDVFWLGYCGNVLAAAGTPRAREETAEWLRVLRLLEAAGDPDEYAALLPRLPRLRPSIPPALLEPDPQPEAAERPTVGDGPGDALAEERERIRKEVGRLHDARATIRRVSAEKLSGSLRGARARVFAERGPGAAPPDAAASSSSGDLRQNASDEMPWHLAHEDLRDEPEARAVLEELDLQVEAAPAPVLVDAIDQRIALLDAEADGLGKREELALIGGTVRRVTRRIPPPAPARGAR